MIYTEQFRVGLVTRVGSYPTQDLKVYKISCKQIYENVPNNITNSNRVLPVQPVAIPFNFNPRAKTTLTNPTDEKKSQCLNSDWR
jgi:hypothetical protein